MEYAYLQLGQEKQAKAIVDEAAAVTKVQFPGLSVDNALAAIPARYALERGAWAEAAALDLRPGTSAYAAAITYFARTLGAVRTGDTAGAEQDVAHMEGLPASYASKPEQQYWAGQAQVLLDAASAWLALGHGKKDQALQGMLTAADLEDSSEKNVAMENRLFPMRELLGYMLLETGQPRQALVEFEASLKSKPNRLRGFYGAAKAAEALGDRAATRAWYEKLEELTRNAGTERAELVEAKAFLAGKE
jgi:tetratricopeptide (TPR) repeat protein